MSTPQIKNTVSNETANSNKNYEPHIINDVSFQQEINDPNSKLHPAFCKFCKWFYAENNSWVNDRTTSIYQDFITSYSKKSNKNILNELEIKSLNAKLPFAQFIVDIYTQCVINHNWTINEFMEKSKLLSSIPKNTKVWKSIRRHLTEYSRYIYKPINNDIYSDHDADDHEQDEIDDYEYRDCNLLNNNKQYIKHNKHRILHYIHKIEEQINPNCETYQMDIIFIPHFINKINDKYMEQHTNRYKQMHFLVPKESIRGIKNYTADRNKQPQLRGIKRCVLLIMYDTKNIKNDIIYLMEPKTNNTLPSQICNDTELPWICNSKSPIFPDDKFDLDEYNALCLSFHQHSNAQRVYLSRGTKNFIRVFKRNISQILTQFCNDSGPSSSSSFLLNGDEFKDDPYKKFVNTYFKDVIPHNGYIEDEEYTQWVDREYDYTFPKVECVCYDNLTVSDDMLSLSSTSRIGDKRYSKLVTYDCSKLVNYDVNSNNITNSDININYSESARIIWSKACAENEEINNQQETTLNKLYPHLVHEYNYLTYNDKPPPTSQQIQPFFERIAARDNNKESIHIDNFDLFYGWWESLCYIINDLRDFFIASKQEIIDPLFYGKITSQQKLEYKRKGTFLLRFGLTINKLIISYKSQSGIKHLNLRRKSDGLYQVYHKNNVTETDTIYNIIMSKPKLKFLYTPHEEITKMLIDCHSPSASLSPTMSLSFPQTTPSINYDKKCLNYLKMQQSVTAQTDHETPFEMVSDCDNDQEFVASSPIPPLIFNNNYLMAIHKSPSPSPSPVASAVSPISNMYTNKIINHISSKIKRDLRAKPRISHHYDAIDETTVYEPESYEDIITVYGGGGNNGKSKRRKKSNRNGKRNNNGNRKSNDKNGGYGGNGPPGSGGGGGPGRGGGGYGGNGGGGGGGGDGDDDPNEDQKYDEIAGDSVLDEEKAVDGLLQILGLLQNEDLDDDELRVKLTEFKPKIVEKVSSEIQALHECMQRIVSLSTVTPIELPRAPSLSTPSLSTPATSLSDCPSSKRRKKTNRGKSKSLTPKKKTHSYSKYTPKKPKGIYKIPRQFTKDLPNKISERIDDSYEFLIKSLGMNHKTSLNHDKVKVFNFDLHDNETKENLYIVAEKRLDEKPSHQWHINQLCTATQVLTNYKIPSDQLPQSQVLKIGHKMQRISQIIQGSITAIITKTKWTKKPIYNKIDHRRRMKLSLTKPEFMKRFEEFMLKFEEKNKEIELIPIVMFDNKDYSMFEYIWIITLEKNIDIGISFKYIENKDEVEVVGIHLHKECIYNQHQIICTKSNDKIDNFNTYITDLHIGNPDDERNQYRALQDKYDKLCAKCVKMEEKYQENALNSIQRSISISTDTNLSETNHSSFFSHNTLDAIQEPTPTPTPTAYHHSASPSISSFSSNNYIQTGSALPILTTSFTNSPDSD